MIGDNLLRFQKEQRYLILDCETCNLNLMDKGNVPWQWAWVDCTLNKIVSRENYYVKWPVINVSRDAARITGFYQRTIDEKGRSPEECLEALDAVLYDPKYKIIIHNGLNFDIYLQNIHRRLLGKPTDYSYLSRVLDTNALAKSVKFDVKPKQDENLLAFQYKFANLWAKGIKTSIKALCDEYNIFYDTEGAHDAAWDVETLRNIWLKLVWQLEI